MSFVHLYILNSGPKYELNYYHFCNINYYYLGIKTKYSRIDLKYFTSGEVVLDPEKGPRGLIENLIRNNKKQRSGIFFENNSSIIDDAIVHIISSAKNPLSSI